jgi:hypothetical protein
MGFVGAFCRGFLAHPFRMIARAPLSTEISAQGNPISHFPQADFRGLIPPWKPDSFQLADNPEFVSRGRYSPVAKFDYQSAPKLHRFGALHSRLKSKLHLLEYFLEATV